MHIYSTDIKANVIQFYEIARTLVTKGTRSTKPNNRFPRTIAYSTDIKANVIQFYEIARTLVTKGTRSTKLTFQDEGYKRIKV